MPLLWARQYAMADDTADGRFLRNITGSFSPDFSIGDLSQVGHYNTQYPGWPTYNLCHWFRFPIDIRKSDFVEFFTAYLQFYWYHPAGILTNGNYNLDIVDPSNTPLRLVLRVYDFDGSDAPIPTTAANAWAPVGAVGYYNHAIGYDPSSFINTDLGDGQYSFNVTDETRGGLDLGASLQAVSVRATNWVKGNHVYVVLYPLFYDELAIRWITFYPMEFIRGKAALQTFAPTLAIYFEEDPQLFENSVEHRLNIEQTLGVYNVPLGIVEHELSIIQNLTLNHVFNRVLDHELLIFQTLTGTSSRWYNQKVEHTLLVQQDVNVTRTHQEDVEHVLTFDQFINVTGPLYGQIEQILNIEQDITANWVFEREIVHTLGIKQEIVAGGPRGTWNVSHWLNIRQDVGVDVSGVVVQGVEHTLTVEQVIDDPLWSGTRDLEHVLTITQSIGVLGPSNGAVCTDPKLVAANPIPAFVSSGNVTLEYPPTTPTHTVIFPPPVYGNREELQTHRVQARTRGGDLRSFKAPTWYSTRTIRMKFDNLTDQQRADMFTFLAASLGKPVKITTHEGVAYTGIMRDPNGEFATFVRICGHTSEFDFEVINVE